MSTIEQIDYDARKDEARSRDIEHAVARYSAEELAGQVYDAEAQANYYQHALAASRRLAEARLQDLTAARAENAQWAKRAGTAQREQIDATEAVKRLSRRLVALGVGPLELADLIHGPALVEAVD